ncbi:DUF4328 domain-containing protein [Streptomyces sp. NPDC048389]|uniref:DUF4328 domain-containing protein n=1 Tax=Streptomyces sp. NPDC048389 TaxID=3154622 RepID=UPI003455C7BF
MLCSKCGTSAATTSEGLCAGCLHAEANTAAPPLPPAMPIAGPTAVLRSPVGLGRALVVLFALLVVTDAAAMGAVFYLRNVMSRFLDTPFSETIADDADRADWLMLWTSVAQSVAVLAVIVLFIIWFYRVRSNAGVFAYGLQRRGQGWAVGAWFIPVANLWIPRGIAVDVWRASRTDPFATDDHQRHTLLNLWWAGFVTTWLVGRYAGRVYDRAESPKEIIDAADVLMVSEVIDIVAAVLAILFVRRLTHMQHTKALAGAQAPTVAV